MRIAVLALQGAFAEHQTMLEQLGAGTVQIRQRSDCEDNFDGLVIPGGESTVMGKLLRELSLFEPIQTAILNGLPVFGTCAGLILLAKEVEQGKVQLGTMDITAKRNAYGRQLGSFSAEAAFDGIGTIPMTFIRAPYISGISGTARPLATVDGKCVAAQQEHQLVTAFHPELTDDLRVHQYFLDMVQHA